MPARYSWWIKRKPVKTICAINILVTLFVWVCVGFGRQESGTVNRFQKELTMCMEEQSQEEESLNSIPINYLTTNQNIYKYFVEIELEGFFFFLSFL